MVIDAGARERQLCNQPSSWLYMHLCWPSISRHLVQPGLCWLGRHACADSAESCTAKTPHMLQHKVPIWPRSCIGHSFPTPLGTHICQALLLMLQGLTSNP